MEDVGRNGNLCAEDRLSDRPWNRVGGEAGAEGWETPECKVLLLPWTLPRRNRKSVRSISSGS